MESTVDQTRSESEGLTSQTGQDATPQSNFPQNVPHYSQAATVPNGNEVVGIATVAQSIETPQEQGEAMNEDVNPTGLGIPNVSGVQVAVAVSAADGVSVVDHGSLANAGATVERTEDGGGNMVTSLPAEYLGTSHLQPQYVIQGSPTDGESFCYVFFC